MLETRPGQPRRLSYRGQDITIDSNRKWHLVAALLGERDRLRDLVENLRAASTNREGFSPHDTADDEAALQADALEGRLKAVEGALDRMLAGVYGRCVACGASISEPRLDALPMTDTCRACAA